MMNPLTSPFFFTPVTRFQTVCFSSLTVFAFGLALGTDLAVVADAQAATQKSAETAKEKARTQSRQKDVEKRLNSLQAELQAKEAKSEEASEALKKADQAISSANRRLRDLREERQAVERELAGLQRSSSAVAGDLREAEDLVALIARAQYVNSHRNAWQSLINGVNPNSLASDGGKLTYLARTQDQAIELLSKKQTDIQTVTQERREQRQTLSRIQREEETERKDLLKDKRDRQLALGKLQSEIKSQQADIERLKKDQARLSNLLSDIDRRLEKERRAEAAAARNKNRKNAGSVTAYVPQSGSFGKLRGKLTRPVSGRIVGQFGRPRSGAGSTVWQGIHIRAPEGADVAACAAGKVVFSDWLRGFGNLIIIDHGNTYMSVYANNESIFKNVGDIVKQGETISSVGSSGGVGEPGLYFELRYKGKPINPQPWLRQ